MKNNIVLAAALCRFAAALPEPQRFEPKLVLDAPSPVLTGPPLNAVETSSLDKRTFVWGNWPWNTDHGKDDDNDDHDDHDDHGNGPEPYPVTTKEPEMTEAPTITTAPTTTNTATGLVTVTTDGVTLTLTNDPACPTQPEDGTYCGFINPQDPCAPQPDGFGPAPTPDTVEAFKSFDKLKQEAQSAPTPEGYKQVFSNLDGSVSGNSYITFFTLKSYDTAACAAQCDSTDKCTSFNLYAERDPSLNPGTNTEIPRLNCPNPKSITNYKCSLWGSTISAESATNKGGFRGEFEVVVTASNGYVVSDETKPVPEVPGYDKPEKCDGGAISEGGSWHLGSKFYPGVFDVGVCVSFAEEKNEQNKGKNSWSNHFSVSTPVSMFNAYMVHKDGHPQGTYCALFSKKLSPSFAKFNKGNFGAAFSIDWSWTYSIKTQKSGFMSKFGW